MSAVPIVRPGGRARLARIADSLAIAVVVSLPWSTSVASLLIVLWLLALVPSLDPSDIRQEIARPAGGLPVALFVLAVLGLAWAEVGWAERLGGLDSFFKLLLIPLLLVQFRRSDRGRWVLVGYLASCTALLAIALTLALWPRAAFIFTDGLGLSVESLAMRDGPFVDCFVALLFLAVATFWRGSRRLAAGMFVLALAFLAYFYFYPVAARGTALPIIVVLVVLLGVTKYPRAMLGVLAVVATVCAAWWAASPESRNLAGTVIKRFHPGDDPNWGGHRPVFWKKSLGFISQAPVLGHGTGAMHQLFVRSTVGQTGLAASETTNPHQQTFAVAIQLGVLGVAVLWAMWLAHLLLFRGNTLPEWIGLVVVSHSIVGSLLDSELFDFTQGSIYVFGVGVAGGMVRRLRAGGEGDGTNSTAGNVAGAAVNAAP
jgi:O-antigen ligase